jgi:hypothetical protein
VRGNGRSRRAAEQSAAKQALETAQHAMAQLGRRPRKKSAAAGPSAAESPAEPTEGHGAPAQTADQAT